MRALSIATIVWGLCAAQADAQIVPETPPPSDAAPVPETAAEANSRAIPRPPVTRIERSAIPGQPDIVITTYPGNLEAPPPAAFNKTYPLCSAALQDGCRNPGSGEEKPELGEEEPVQPPKG